MGLRVPTEVDRVTMRQSIHTKTAGMMRESTETFKRVLEFRLCKETVHFCYLITSVYSQSTYKQQTLRVHSDRIKCVCLC